MLPEQVEFISISTGTTVWGRSGVSDRSGILSRNVVRWLGDGMSSVSCEVQQPLVQVPCCGLGDRQL